MKLKKIITLMSIAFFAAGCAEMHSEQYKNTKLTTEHNLDNISKLRQATVDKVISGATLKDFFVDTNPIKIRVNDVLKLPSKYPSTVRVYSALPESESALAARLNADYGIKIKYSRLIVKKDESKSDSESSKKSKPMITNKVEELSGNSDQGNNLQPEDQAATKTQSYDVDGLPQNVKDGMSVFGMGLEKEDSKLVKPINYNGNIEGLMNLIGADRGLDWKYDEDTDTFVFYDLDTIAFDLIDNSGKTGVSFNMQTSLSGSGEGSSSNTNQSSESSSVYNNWESVVSIVDSLIGENGKVSSNQSQGQIVVTDTRENLSRIKKTIDKINTQSGIQVVLDVTFLKFSLDKSSSLGTDLSALSAADIVGKAVSIKGGSGMLDSDVTTGSLYKIDFNKADMGAMVHALAKYGTINYKFSDEIISLNNQLVPYQSSIDESYVSSIETETDDETKKVTKTPVVSIRKTGVTSSWLPRVIGDRVKIKGYITMARGMAMVKDESLGVTLPKNLSENEPVNLIIDNGKTRIVSIKEIDESKANASGIGSVNTLPIGGTEDTSTTREISVVMVTPYIVK